MLDKARNLQFVVLTVLLTTFACTTVCDSDAQDRSRFNVELEAGPAWQTRNNVQIPNTDMGTRFSLVDLAGKGPVPAVRLYLTWNINDKHGLNVLLAPFQFTTTGISESAIDFAGQSYVQGDLVEATYKFNSWRLGYRFHYVDRERLKLTVGFTAKIRDAKIELSQGSTTSKDTDLGFVPLLNLGANWMFASQWSLLVDADGLAGGPGRAFDVALKLGYTLDNHWSFRAGYRTVEGGADIESVYNFAWIHYAVVSAVYRL